MRACVCRAVAVWSSQRRRLTMFVAVALLVGTAVYSTVATLVSLRGGPTEAVAKAALLLHTQVRSSLKVTQGIFGR